MADRDRSRKKYLAEKHRDKAAAQRNLNVSYIISLVVLIVAIAVAGPGNRVWAGIGVVALSAIVVAIYYFVQLAIWKKKVMAREAEIDAFHGKE